MINLFLMRRYNRLSDIYPLIHVVDDDPSVTRALKRLLHSWGMQAFTFASGAEYLSANDDD
jgi:FixJ family two-component response regulator